MVIQSVKGWWVCVHMHLFMGRLYGRLGLEPFCFLDVPLFYVRVIGSRSVACYIVVAPHLYK